MNTQLSEKDQKEIERFKAGFPRMDIVAPATPGNGIQVLNGNEIREAEEAAALAVSSRTEEKLSFAKFVPASGAASRMFKDLFNKNVSTVNTFVSNIDKFAFYDTSLYDGLEPDAMVDFTLNDSGLGYGSKPKGVLYFHKYPSEIRTALAEHLVEAQKYLKGSDKVAHLVITISPEHQPLFEQAIEDVRSEYEQRYDVHYDIKLVYQYKWTDTIAVTPSNEPFLLDDGCAFHRPAGHGALIHNLADVDADIVSIKNIDNVAVESYLPCTEKWKKVLIGTALKYRRKIFDYLHLLENGASEPLLDEIEDFFKNELLVCLPAGCNRAETLKALLDRPIRVCGMVKNQGEAGGGPFIIREKDGSTSLQILEGAQINPDDAHARAALAASTHFNPVDIVCVLKNSRGEQFDLPAYVDENAGLISFKSYQGRDLKALELPGLWNGSMSRWNTVFVEVPLETFNPVKTVLDLLRPAHQN